jgi:hypothetical protein
LRRDSSLINEEWGIGWLLSPYFLSITIQSCALKKKKKWLFWLDTHSTSPWHGTSNHPFAGSFRRRKFHVSRCPWLGTGYQMCYSASHCDSYILHSIASFFLPEAPSFDLIYFHCYLSLPTCLSTDCTLYFLLKPSFWWFWLYFTTKLNKNWLSCLL